MSEREDPSALSPGTRGVSRREFVKAAVAIGGTSAMAACMGREELPDLPGGPEDLAALPDRQHAWNDFVAVDDHGNHRSPRHHVVVLLDYGGDGAPVDGDRETVEEAFRSIERAYQRSNEGLLFTVSYSPAFFDRTTS